MVNYLIPYSHCMKYSWKLLDNGAQFETFADLERFLVDSGHENYPEENHPIAYMGRESWEQRLYSEVEAAMGKDTWFCDDTTDEFRSRYGHKAGMPFGGEFGSLEEAKLNCTSKPYLRVPDQFEFERGLVMKWLKAAGKVDGRGKNSNSLKNLKPFSQ